MNSFKCAKCDMIVPWQNASFLSSETGSRLCVACGNQNKGKMSSQGSKFQQALLKKMEKPKDDAGSNTESV